MYSLYIKYIPEKEDKKPTNDPYIFSIKVVNSPNTSISFSSMYSCREMLISNYSTIVNNYLTCANLIKKSGDFGKLQIGFGVSDYDSGKNLDAIKFLEYIKLGLVTKIDKDNIFWVQPGEFPNQYRLSFFLLMLSDHSNLLAKSSKEICLGILNSKANRWDGIHSQQFLTACFAYVSFKEPYFTRLKIDVGQENGPASFLEKMFFNYISYIGEFFNLEREKIDTFMEENKDDPKLQLYRILLENHDNPKITRNANLIRLYEMKR